MKTCADLSTSSEEDDTDATRAMRIGAGAFERGRVRNHLGTPENMG